MKTLHLAGTILGLFGCSLVLTVACSGDTKRNTVGTGGTGNGGGNNGGTGNTVGGGSNNGGTGNVLPPVDCVSTAIVDAATPLIADFECLPGAGNQKFDWFPWPDYLAWQHGAYWYYDGADAYDPSYQTWTCSPTARGGMSQPGHSGVNAGYVEALVPKTSWGAGFGIWMGGAATNPDTDTGVSCIDASVFDGITFWVKGTNTGSNPAGTYRVEFKTFDTANAYPATPRTCSTDADGGNVCTGDKAGGCTAAKCDPYTYTGVLTDTWTQVNIKWTDLIAPTTGVTAPFNAAKLAGINIALPSDLYGGTVQFYIDDVEFTGGGPTEIGRECPAAAGGATGAGGAPDYSVWQTAGAGGTVAALPACDGTAVAAGGAP